MRLFFLLAMLVSVNVFPLKYAIDEMTFWYGFDRKINPFTLWIKKHAPHAELVRITQKPDVIICGIHGRNKTQGAIAYYKKIAPSAKRVVCYSQEPRMVKNNGKYDHFFSFTREFTKKNTYMPNWLYRAFDWNLIGNDAYYNLLLYNKRALNHDRPKFCCFLHKNEADFRGRFLATMAKKYKTIDCGGKLHNNIGRLVGTGVENKMKFFSQYKFCMAMENNQLKDYCTEKLVDGLMSGALPIYWGDPDVANDFNPELFINVKNGKDVSRAISLIKHLDQNPEAYLSYFEKPVASQFIRDLLTTKREQYEKWVVSKILGIDLGDKPLMYHSFQEN
ncbi:MAG: glycosyltransferase family 10 [Simkaniaceae bacterium]|nr:glycosyltransferase family 10 [Simkaniaceae bacterium]